MREEKLSLRKSGDAPCSSNKRTTHRRTITRRNDRHYLRNKNPCTLRSNPNMTGIVFAQALLLNVIRFAVTFLLSSNVQSSFALDYHHKIESFQLPLILSKPQIDAG